MILMSLIQSYLLVSLPLLFSKNSESLVISSVVKERYQLRSIRECIPRNRRVALFALEQQSVAAGNVSRRSLVQLLGTASSFPFFLSGHPALGDASLSPLAELPMQKLRLPKGAFGRDYVVIQLKVQGKGPFDFMLDSGLTTELITPHLQKVLGIKGGDTSVTGLAAGAGATGKLVELSGASLCCGSFASGNELQLPTLNAVVIDFPQEHLDPAHDPVEGMLGMEMLQLFDADFDFPKGILRLWSPGTAVSISNSLIEIPAAVLNESGLIGIRLIGTKQAYEQPMVGILDCGSSCTIINWAAAELLGLPRDEKAYSGNPSIMGIGVDGQPQTMPTTKTQFTFCGNAYSSQGKMAFSPPPSNWKPWDPITVAIGDLPAFAELLGDGKTPYKGPAVLVGLDILSQRRVIFETGGNGKARRLFVAPFATSRD